MDEHSGFFDLSSEGGSLPWPTMPDGQPETPAFLENVSGFELDCQLAVSMLESCGIPVLRRTSSGGTLCKIYFGFSGSGVDLYVPESRLEEATALISSPVELVDFPEGDEISGDETT